MGATGVPACVRSTNSRAVTCSIPGDSHQAESKLQSEPRRHPHCREAWLPFLPLSQTRHPPAALWSSGCRATRTGSRGAAPTLVPSKASWAPTGLSAKCRWQRGTGGAQGRGRASGSGKASTVRGQAWGAAEVWGRQTGEVFLGRTWVSQASVPASPGARGQEAAHLGPEACAACRLRRRARCCLAG